MTFAILFLQVLSFRYFRFHYPSCLPHHLLKFIFFCKLEIFVFSPVGCVQMRLEEPLKSQHLFYASTFTDSLLNGLGGELAKVWSISFLTPTWFFYTPQKKGCRGKQVLKSVLIFYRAFSKLNASANICFQKKKKEMCQSKQLKIKFCSIIVTVWGLFRVPAGQNNWLQDSRKFFCVYNSVKNTWVLLFAFF